MSEEETNIMRDKLCYGLQLAEWKMLREKAQQNGTIVTKTCGQVKEVSARYLYRKLYGNCKQFPGEASLM